MSNPTKAGATHFQRTGYKKDDLFRVVTENTNHAPHQITIGSLVQLVRDDGSDWPAFGVVLGGGPFGPRSRAYIQLDALEVVRG